MKVVYVIDSLRRHGTQRFLVGLSCALARKGYQQCVYCLNEIVDPRFAADLRAAGVEFQVIGRWRLLTLAGVVRMVMDCRQRKPDLLVTLLPFSDIVGRIVGRLSNGVILVSSIRARNIDKPLWQKIIDRVTVRWVKRVVFNSQEGVAFSIKHEGVRPGQVVYIPNGIAMQPNAMPRSAARATLGIAEGLPIVGVVGRLSPQKGYSTLLAAFDRVVKARPQATLVIVGDGDLRRELEADTRRRGIDTVVRFLGQRDDVSALLPAFDLYVQPSLWEGMPNAVMEAMVAGLPVVATDVDGTRALIRDGEHGWLVPPGDSDTLAERLLHALTHREESEGMGQAARERMTREFSVEKMVDAYDALFQGLISEKRLVV